MDYRFRRDNTDCDTKDNDFDIALGMESCLKKLVLEARRQAFRTRKRAVASQWDHLGENIVLGCSGA